MREQPKRPPAKIKLEVADNVSLDRDGHIRRAGDVFQADKDDESNAGSRSASDYRPEVGFDSPYVTICESCGWEEEPRA